MSGRKFEIETARGKIRLRRQPLYWEWEAEAFRAPEGMPRMARGRAPRRASALKHAGDALETLALE